MSVPAFEVRELMRRFGDRVALHPTTWEVARGERVALVGPSGAGKTTLLRLLAGTLAPTAGSVRVLGRPLISLSSARERARLVGILPQRLDLVPNVSVAHNVLAGALGRWGFFGSLGPLLAPTRARAFAEVRDALRSVGLEALVLERTARLSGGEQQRVALARLLVQKPQVVLADEPVSSLDPANAEALVRLLVAMASEGRHTLIASLHATPLARRHFDRIVGLRDGAVVFDRRAAEVGEDDLAALYALEEYGPGGPDVVLSDEPRVTR